jgi:hypothetical protein
MPTAGGAETEGTFMNSDQYEELCRLFIAEKVGLGVEEVKSVKIPNARRPDLPTYKHQIDLYWETGDEIAQYLNIANAKWRGSDRVDQPEVLLLAKVREKVHAHKAFMLSSIGFTSGAVAAARDEGIALHLVTPAIDTSLLPQKGRSAILSALLRIAGSSSGSIYHHVVECRGLGFTESSAPTTGRQAGRASGSLAPETRVVPPSTTRTDGSAERRGGPGFGTMGPAGGPERRG